MRILYQPSLSYPRILGDASVLLPRMYMLEGNTKVAMPYDSTPSGTQALWLTPVVNPPIGAQLVVETDATGCSLDAPLVATYSISEARALPGTLGTLQASVKRARLQIAVDLGACSLPADIAYADLSISPSDQAQPFAALFRYQLFVDGQPHPSFVDNSASSRRLPHGTDRVYAQCGDIDGGINGTTALRPGVHTVHFRAQIGDETPLRTEDVRIELSCEGSAPITPYDGGLDTPRSELSGGCSLGDRTHGNWFALVLAALLLLKARRSA